MKKSIKRIMALTVIGATLLTTLPIIGASAEWRKQDSTEQWIYMENGSYVQGWKEIDSKWYYFAPNGYMTRNTYVNGYQMGSDGAWIQNTTTNVQNKVINESIPITIPSNWRKLTNSGYILENKSALVYEAKDLNGASYDQELWAMGSAIIQNVNNFNVHTTYKTYNGQPAMCYEYFDVVNGETKRNYFVVAVTNTKLYGFLLVGNDDYKFTLDVIDLEYVLNTSLFLK
jgi:hypothetical protein